MFGEGALGDIRRLLLQLTNTPKSKVRARVMARVRVRLKVRVRVSVRVILFDED